MKTKAITFVVMLLAAHSFAQSLQKEIQHPDIASRLFHNPSKSGAAPEGSPYIQTAFAKAKVVKAGVDAFMRYNAFSDEFEFINAKNDTLVLDKIDDFSDIDFAGLRKKYRLLAYTDSHNKLSYGYLILLSQKNDIALYKKESVNFTEAKVAKTTLERSMPARYTKGGDAYFIKVKDGTATEFPDGKKDLCKMFPDKKAAIESFIKENKIDLDSEADKMRIVDFLAAP